MVRNFVHFKVGIFSSQCRASKNWHSSCWRPLSERNSTRLAPEVCQLSPSDRKPKQKLTQGQHLTILHRMKISPQHHSYIFPLSITIQNTEFFSTPTSEICASKFGFLTFSSGINVQTSLC